MKKQNLSEYDETGLPDAYGLRIGIVVSDWNGEITGAMLTGALETLEKYGIEDDDILVKHVPGAFELTMGARLMLENYMLDALIVLGCVIQGETRHFDFICQGVTQGITTLNLDYDVPVIFGVLTTEDFQQAKARAGGKNGNKGVEAALTAMKMISLVDEIIEESEILDLWEEDDEFGDELSDEKDENLN
jgi:6,7-dimethyl-8-ribityllumazine synthase